MQRIKLCLFLWGLFYISVLPSSAQSIPSDSVIFIPTGSIKNNLLYDATLTPNIGLEVKIGSRSSFQAFYGINPWKFSDTKKWRHWSLMPEYRYWLNKENIEQSRLLVISDDVAIPVGQFRLKANGSNGGHNGLGHIQQLIGQQYARLRMGIGNDYPVGSPNS